MAVVRHSLVKLRGPRLFRASMERALKQKRRSQSNRQSQRFDQQGRTAPAHKFTSAEDYFRVQYFALVDCVIKHIVECCDQPDMKIYCSLASVLSACRDEEIRSDGVNKLCELYEDFNRGLLELQLRFLPGLCSVHW